MADGDDFFDFSSIPDLWNEVCGNEQQPPEHQPQPPEEQILIPHQQQQQPPYFPPVQNDNRLIVPNVSQAITTQFLNVDEYDGVHIGESSSAPGRNVVAPQLTTQSTPQIPHLQTSYQIPHIQRRLVIGESNNPLGRRGKRRPPLLFEDILQHLQKKIRVAARELEVSPSTLGKRFKVFFPTETWPGERYPWLRLRPRTSWPHKPPYTIPSIFEMHSPTSHAQSSHTGPTWQEESSWYIPIRIRTRALWELAPDSDNRPVRLFTRYKNISTFSISMTSTYRKLNKSIKLFPQSTQQQENPFESKN
ncbi:hypothetical protein Tco_0018035 [Tanacetum coccineum]